MTLLGNVIMWCNPLPSSFDIARILLLFANPRPTLLNAADRPPRPGGVVIKSGLLILYLPLHLDRVQHRLDKSRMELQRGRVVPPTIPSRGTIDAETCRPKTKIVNRQVSTKTIFFSSQPHRPGNHFKLPSDFRFFVMGMKSSLHVHLHLHLLHLHLHLRLPLHLHLLRLIL